MKQLLCSAIALVALGNIPVALAQRDTISIVGSSTVYPFSTVVAERFGKSGSFNTPKVESTGTGGGIKLFCAGVGVQYPDVVNASRRMKQGELDDCRKNGVGEVVEVTIGYDGIVVANSIEAPIYDLTPKDLWLALAKAVPNPDGSETLVANPYKTWQQVNLALPATAIEVLRSSPDHRRCCRKQPSGPLRRESNTRTGLIGTKAADAPCGRHEKTTSTETDWQEAAFWRDLPRILSHPAKRGNTLESSCPALASLEMNTISASGCFSSRRDNSTPVYPVAPRIPIRAIPSYLLRSTNIGGARQ